MGDNGKEKYPHSEFRVPATDNKGHVERLQIRMQPELAAKMQKVVNSKLWPYEDPQQLVRHAIHRQIRWLENDNPQVGNLLSQIEAINMIMVEETEHQRMSEMYEKTKMLFNDNLRIAGETATGRNLKLISDIWNKIQGIDDEFWRGVWMDRFREEYKTVLAHAPNANLMDLDEGDE